MDDQKSCPIAVVGMGCLFPGATEKETFWKNILDGKDFITDVPKTHWLIEDYYDPTAQDKTKTYAKRGGFIPEVDFDPLKYGLLPKAISSTDTSQLLALLVANQVLEDASNLQLKTVDREKISVILGVASGTELLTQMAAKIQEPVWQNVLKESGLPENEIQEICEKVYKSYAEWDEGTFPGLLGNVVAGRIANRLNLGGTNCIIDAACASSLAAIAMGMHELQLGYSDLVITGGVDAFNDIFMFMCFTKTPALSITGDCRPFSTDADGTMLGEGVGMLALRRLEDAERDGDHIYAVIRGIGTSSDGKGKSVYAPNSEGQSRAIINAYKKAGYGFDEVELMEAHGTATLAGDVAEFAGLCKAKNYFGAGDNAFCALGSVKSQIGHTKAAAGAASLIKTIMALHHKVYPPTIKVKKPNYKLDIANSPFYLNTTARPWIHPLGSSRKAGVSSFGFGGSNYHVTVEEYRGAGKKPKRILHSPVHLLLFSGVDSQELENAVIEIIESSKNREIESLARRLQIQFEAGHNHRLAVLIGKNENLTEVLHQAVTNLRKNRFTDCFIPGRIYYATGSLKGKIAFLFPGQGSQYVNMGADMTMAFNDARETWDRACSIHMTDENKLHDVAFPPSVFSENERTSQTETLKRTEWAQPALGTISASQLKILDKIGIKAEYLAGHSYGEVTALFAGGMIKNLEDFIKISRKRGELMTDASSLAGAMTAVMAESAQVVGILKNSSTDVCIANINSPNQTVISGELNELEKVENILRERGFLYQRLPVSTAFHSKLVEKSVDPFYQYLQSVEFNKTSQKVFSNSTGDIYNNQKIKETLAGQLAQPVLFQKQIERLYENGVRIFLEVGAGSVLTKMVGDCLKNKEHVAVALDKRGENGVASFWHALGRLSVAGVDILYSNLWEEFLEIQPENNKKFSPTTVKINGANYGKPYPPLKKTTNSSKRHLEVQTPKGIKIEDQKNNHKQKLSNSTQEMGRGVPVKSGNEEDLTNRSVSIRNLDPQLEIKQTNVRFNNERLLAFQQIQQNTFEAQKMFQMTLAETHMRFLDVSSEAIRQLSVLSGINPQIIEAPTQAFSSPFVDKKTIKPELSQEVNIDSSSKLVNGDPFFLNTVNKNFPDNDYTFIPRPPVLKSSESAKELEKTKYEPPVVEATTNFKTILLEVVADKTGFPADIIDLNMDMESELGIDSIKKVEILSALQVKIPTLKELDTGRLATTRTLQEILDYVNQSRTEETSIELKKN